MDPGASDFFAARILLDEFSPSKELHQRRHLASSSGVGNGVGERFLNLTRAGCWLLSVFPQAKARSGFRALYRVLGTGNWCIQNRRSFPDLVSSHDIYQ